MKHIHTVLTNILVLVVLCCYTHHYHPFSVCIEYYVIQSGSHAIYYIATHIITTPTHMYK